MAQMEQDFPPGHPKRVDFDPDSREAKDWEKRFGAGAAQRDFTVGHPGAMDTEGNRNSVEWQAGVDPDRPHLESFTGRDVTRESGKPAAQIPPASTAQESPVRKPVDYTKMAPLLAEKRREVGRDELTPEEFAEVEAAYHLANPS